ncbi:MAG: glutamate-5-semialdehyde dehydrogenase, partial [Bacillota bacterium]
NLARVRVPLGVIGIIYEARPNVTVDAAGLCLKSGNVTVLRGGSEATHSNAELVRHIRYALESRGLPADACQLIEDTSRAAAKELMSAREYLDVLIPRGGASLIRAVVDNARVPVIETGVGNCHTFVDAGADLEMAVRIAHNAKVQRPGVCNSMETLLIHADIADEFLPAVAHRLEDSGVQLRGCPRTREYLPHVTPAAEADWETEYLDLILAVRVVEDFDEAVEHIRRYGTRHSEAIVTSDYSHARRFTDEVDAAAVYVNASTRFTDGSEFGLGAEIGISTQKMHARGPMGLEELTSCKYVITGDGQIR